MAAGDHDGKVQLHHGPIGMERRLELSSLLYTTSIKCNHRNMGRIGGQWVVTISFFFTPLQRKKRTMVKCTSASKPKRKSYKTKRGRSRKNVAGKYKAPDPRAEEIVRQYHTAMAEYRGSHIHAFHDMLGSSSLQTDDHVARMMSTMNIPREKFEDDVLFMVRHIWTTATENLETDKAELKPLLNISRLLFLLRDSQTRNKKLIEGINAVKRLVANDTVEEHPCSLLTCPNPGRHDRIMNSRRYCDDHFGLALFNGLRHGCDACHVWSMLAMRFDISGGHMQNSIKTLEVPLKDETTHMRLNVRLQRFCDVSKKRGLGPLRFHGANQKPLSYRAKTGEYRLVPPNSFCHQNTYGHAVAWINIMTNHLPTDEWRPVTSMEKYKSIMDQLGWKDNGWTSPPFCPSEEESAWD